MSALPIHIKLYIQSQIDLYDVRADIIPPIKNYISSLDLSDCTKVSYISLVKKHISEKYEITFDDLAFPQLTKHIAEKKPNIQIKKIKKDNIEYIRNLKDSEDIYNTMLYYLLNSGRRICEIIRPTEYKDDKYYIQLAKKRNHIEIQQVELLDTNPDFMYELYMKYKSLNTNVRNITVKLNNRIKKIDTGLCVKDLREIYTHLYELGDDISICNKIEKLLHHSNPYISIHYNKIQLI